MDRLLSKNEISTIIIKVICFITIFVFLLIGFSYVLRDKTAASEILSFKDEKHNSLDVLFLGPSTMETAVSPMYLWKEYGIASYNISMGGQSIPINYYNLKMAVEIQSPKLVVMDIGYLFMKSKNAGQPARFRQFLDNTRFSFVKIEAIADIIDSSEWVDHLFNIIYYHSRWKEIGEKDFKEIVNYDKGSVSSLLVAGLNNDLVVLEESDILDVNGYEISTEYLSKIIDLCKNNNIILLFVNLPSYATGKVNHGNGEELQKMWNGFSVFAEENEVKYINFLHKLDEIDFDFSTDCFDWRHVNYFGSIKITKYLGAYITENYNIPDRRLDSDYVYWYEDYEKYEKYIDYKLAEFKEQNDN